MTSTAENHKTAFSMACRIGSTGTDLRAHFQRQDDESENTLFQKKKKKVSQVPILLPWGPILPVHP